MPGRSKMLWVVVITALVLALGAIIAWMYLGVNSRLVNAEVYKRITEAATRFSVVKQGRYIESDAHSVPFPTIAEDIRENRVEWRRHIELGAFTNGYSINGERFSVKSVDGKVFTLMISWEAGDAERCEVYCGTSRALPPPPPSK